MAGPTQTTRSAVQLDPSRIVADQLTALSRDLIEPASNQDVRDAAAHRLLAIGSAEARNAVLSALRDPANNPGRLAAARAIAEDLPPDPQFIDGLFALLEPDTPRPIVDAAVESLGNYKLEPDVSNRLIELSKPGKPDNQRIAAVRALGAQIEKRAAEQLVVLTQDRSTAVAAAAGEALRAFAASPIDSPGDWWKTQADKPDDRFRLETLAARSAHSESEARRGEETFQELRRSVLGAITAAPREQRGDVLLKYLKSPRVAVRQIAVTQAYEFTTTGDLPDAVRPALRDLVSDPDADVRLAAVRTLSALADAGSFDAIAKQTPVESDPRVRFELAKAMGLIGNVDAMPLLRWLLDDASTPVVVSAAGSIARLAEPAATQDPTSAAELAIRLQALLQTRATDPALRESLLEALVPLKQRSMVSTFTSILTANPREPETIRRLACRGLGAIGAPQTAPVLVETMRDLDATPAVRAEAAKAVGQVSTTFENAEAIYRAMTRDPDPAVARTEWDTIKSLLPKAPMQQLMNWPNLPEIAGNDERLLDIQQALESLAAASGEADQQTFYQQQAGDTLMRLGDRAEASRDLVLARQRFSEATSQYSAALKLTREKGFKLSRADSLMINTVKSLLRSRDYAGAAKFASEEFRGPNGKEAQGILSPEFKLEAERLADPNAASPQFDDALALIKEALAMTPPLGEMTRGHLLEVQRGVESRQHEHNEFAVPEYWQALASAK